MAELNTNEARLIALYRAIDRFAEPRLIGPGEVGQALVALVTTTDIEQIEKDLDDKQLESYVNGFVAGLGASRLEEVLAEPQYYPDDETQFIGGPSGGVAEGQGEDARYVTQSGAKSATKE